jgi:tRNA(Arg) A34 adenosine deaminase TadA
VGGVGETFSSDLLHEVRVVLPGWVPAMLERHRGPFAAAEERMRLTIALARGNVERSTGGPFGAAVFERESGVLIAVGVNCVVAQHCSSAHAEIMALSLAQRRLGTYTLAGSPRPLQLVSSVEPCAMCLGAIAWSGVSELVTGATDADARDIGFDEGVKPSDWTRVLTTTDVVVRTGVLRAEARDVLELYRRSGGEIYNG